MAELKPGEFLITREQHRQLMLDILSGRKRIEHEVLEATSTDPDAFTRELDGPVDCRGEPLDLGPDLEPKVVCCPREAWGDGTCEPGCVGPATRADLAELDAVPEPVDSDAPREVHQTTSLTPAPRAR